MSRKVAREKAYLLVFEYLFNNKPNTFTFEKFLLGDDVKEEDQNYITDVYKGVIEHYDELIDTIKKHLRKFVIERVLNADKAILLLAIYEMKYVDSVPLSVSINEAVEIIKKYSTEKSPSFVNGILGSVFKDIQGEK